MDSTIDSVTVNDLQFDHKLWLNELHFFENQMNFMEEKLEEIVRTSKNNIQVMANIEAFQNRIIRQKEVIDEFKHKIRLREQDLEKIPSGQIMDQDHIFYTEHDHEIDEMDTFIKLYELMRDEFKVFLKKNRV